jgi:hypothetical protein
MSLKVLFFGKKPLVNLKPGVRIPKATIVPPVGSGATKWIQFPVAVGAGPTLYIDSSSILMVAHYNFAFVGVTNSAEVSIDIKLMNMLVRRCMMTLGRRRLTRFNFVVCSNRSVTVAMQKTL